MAEPGSAAPFQVTLLTLFPEMFDSYLHASILGKAHDRGHLAFNFINIRDFAADKHKTVDDTPYGGGDGMILKPEPACQAIAAARREGGAAPVIHLTPTGALFSSELARDLAQGPGLILLCGRYEGIDQRVMRHVDIEISIGDYVLTGGELAAMVVIDAVSRFRQGVLGNAGSSEEESLSGGALEYPQYTRPRLFQSEAVPEVLLSGDHQRIARWRRQQSLRRTRDRRPDLFAKLTLSGEDLRLLEEAEL